MSCLGGGIKSCGIVLRMNENPQRNIFDFIIYGVNLSYSYFIHLKKKKFKVRKILGNDI